MGETLKVHEAELTCLPHAREHVAVNLGLAIVGILVASLTLGTGVTRTAADGGPRSSYLLLPALPTLAASSSGRRPALSNSADHH